MWMRRWWCDGFTPIQYILTNCFLTELKNYNSDRGEERMTRGIPSLLLRRSTWSSEPWNMERRERLHWETWWHRHSQHTGLTGMSCQCQRQYWLLSDTNVSDWDLRYRSAFSRTAAQSIIEQSVNDLTVSIYVVELHFICLEHWEW